MKKIKSITVIACFAFLAAGSGEQPNQQAATRPSTTQTPEISIPIPESQQQFIDGITRLQSAVFNAKNSIQAQRAKDTIPAAVSNSLNGSTNVLGWVGQVTHIGPYGAFEVILTGTEDLASISKDYTISTACVGIFPTCEKNIQPGTALYEVIANLQVGDTVRFSGRVNTRQNYYLDMTRIFRSLPLEFTSIEKL